MTRHGSSGRRRRRFRAGGSMIPMPAGMREVGVMSDINVTPMIDVMIVLLILFMVVTPVITNYAIRPPTAANVTPEKEEDAVEVGIDQGGAFWVGDQRVAVEDLPEYLARVYAARPGDHLLYLRADRGIGYERVLDLVDAARAAGVRRIGAIADPQPRPAEGESEVGTR